MDEPWDDALDALTVLVEPVRRSMYLYARRQMRGVTRDEVAEATGTSVKLAAFHLDKLVEHGWLHAEHDRTSRPGTGGRPPKRYAPTDRNLQVSLPPRRYDLMGEILLATRATITDDVRRAARDRGRVAAERLRRNRPGRRLGAERTLAAVSEVLTELGFEPGRTDDGEIVMANCPFGTLADTAPGTVCEAAKALVEGVIDGARGSRVEAECDRSEGRCCVVLRRV